jgi:hypothetical protein
MGWLVVVVVVAAVAAAAAAAAVFAAAAAVFQIFKYFSNQLYSANESVTKRVSNFAHASHFHCRDASKSHPLNPHTVVRKIQQEKYQNYLDI